ncbi:uncharacterized protein LOC110059316 [Orbicella faveolata]|uniref:uncharacterized protein LOC110059316 n=1 Tax=Orbicella faveolata TaxID=48498 RepID=UPI0009E1FB98|nr:uncharacterized protein LOC110059316 [Orbicella faveolata]
MGQAMDMVLQRKIPLSSGNHIHRQCAGILQHDGGSVQFQIGAQANAKVLLNWVHSSPKYGIRFDGQPPKVGVKGTIMRNVVWKTNGIMVKGNFHKVENNLAFDKRNDKSGDNQGRGCTLCVLRKVRSNRTPINGKTKILRNAADAASDPSAGKWKDNMEGDVRTMVMDADNLDFRPRKNSACNKAEAGPYLISYNPRSREYWIPGRKLYKASTSVPPNGSTTVKVNETENESTSFDFCTVFVECLYINIKIRLFTFL